MVLAALRLSILLLACLVAFGCKQSESRIVLHGDDLAQVSALMTRIDTLNGRGEYASAIESAQELLRIVESSKGPDDPALAPCLNILAGLYVSLGDDGKAIPLLLRAKALPRTADGSDASDRAGTLALLANAYADAGRYAEALVPAQDALAIREATLGPDHFMVSTSFEALGAIHLRMGKTAEAEFFFKRALDIRRAYGNPHAIALTLSQLSETYLELDAPDAARPLAELALEMAAQVLDENHPLIAQIQNVLGRIDALQGRDEAALDRFLQAQRIHLEIIDRLKGVTSEKQKLKFLATIERDYWTFLSLVATRLPDSPRAREAALDIVLRRKGVVLELQKSFQEAPLGDDADARGIFTELSAVRAEMSRMAYAEPDGKGSDYKQRMAALATRKEALEGRLRKLQAGQAIQGNALQVDAASVAAGLPPGSALIEYVRLPIRSFDTGKGAWSREQYVAFVLNPAQSRRPALHRLGDADAIDRAVLGFKQAVSKPSLGAPAQSGEGQDKRGIAIMTAGSGPRQDVLAPCKALRRLVFDALGKAAPLPERLFIAPDSMLNVVPFEVMSDEQGRFLVEKFAFNYLASGRDILGFGGKKSGKARAIIFGAPDFDASLASAPPKTGNDGASAPEAQGGLRAPSGFTFPPLSGALAEAEAVQAILGRDSSELFVGAAASEQNLKSCKNPGILHLATHGFFFAGAVARSDARNPAPGLVKPDGNGSPVEHSGMDNPLLRSGFVLAGANRALEAGDRLDGVITAEKVLGLPMRSTKLVVLSACETGLGEVMAGEGVFGLRRAFTQAGARSLVMSMWSVPDRETKELMVGFYRNLVGGQDRCQALRHAMLAQIETVRNRRGTAHPFYFGAFVFQGEP